MPNAELTNSDRSLLLRRVLPASPAKVFQAFIDPEILKQWMGPGEVECVSIQTDVSVGGRYRMHMRSEQRDHIVVGEYVEIVPNERLVFTWSWETGAVKNTLVTVTFRSVEEGTELELLHEQLPERDAVLEHTEGWAACLDNLVEIY